jgi:Prokaryotic E2 family D
MPPTLMLMTMTARQLVSSSLWVVKAGMEKKLHVGSTDPTLAAFPYGNVYSHGKICWGDTPIRELHHPQEVEDAFFQSGFNGDLTYLGNCGAGERTLPDLIKQVKKDLPIPTTFSTSVAAAIQGMA